MMCRLLRRTGPFGRFSARLFSITEAASAQSPSPKTDLHFRRPVADSSLPSSTPPLPTTLTFKVESDYLIAYGLIPEFVGEISSFSKLIGIIRRPTGSGQTAFYKEQALKLIAQKALVKNTGAQGYYIFEVPEDCTGFSSVSAVLVDEEYVGPLDGQGCGSIIIYNRECDRGVHTPVHKYERDIMLAQLRRHLHLLHLCPGVLASALDLLCRRRGPIFAPEFMVSYMIEKLDVS
ncbi:hypothetical protein SAY87_020685 [Trapa incisa]|uniref:Uncharacterized protein n=1 Tax=Trapa incisa TaxID=236973 RepID=A0AAN7JQJ4_9MYRT|nr:hypothetical protein SAY87_020685 [Trapa incisa]